MSMKSLLATVGSPALRRRLTSWLYNFYPPHLGSGIRLEHVSEDRLTLRTALRARFWNRNFVGTHYGASLYAMCDAPFMLILIEALGTDYIVWDKAASIRFRKPGRGTVRAEFRIPASTVESLRETLRAKDKHDTTFYAQVVDEAGEVVAEVEKVLHVRRKNTAPRQEPRQRKRAKLRA
jgi:hypothetical protein